MKEQWEGEDRDLGDKVNGWIGNRRENRWWRREVQRRRSMAKGLGGDDRLGD